MQQGIYEAAFIGSTLKYVNSKVLEDIKISESVPDFEPEQKEN